MHKLTLLLQRINASVTLKFSVTIRPQSPDNRPGTISTFNFNGNDYTNIRPYPYVIIDLGNELKERNGVFNTNSSIALDHLHMYWFLKRCKKLMRDFVEEKQLFVYQGNHLLLNQELSEKCEIILPCEFSKTIRVKPVVVKDYQQHIECEGVMIMVNDVANFATLTIEEFEYMLYTMSKLDFHGLSTNLISIYFSGIRSNQNQPQSPQQFTNYST